MKFLKTLILCLAVMSAMSCKSQYELLLKSNDVQAKYDAAFNFFNAKKYTRAASLFESLSVLTSGTPKQDTVQYYWGLSNYRYKDYYTAEANFSKFLENYPSSPFAADARYLKIDCLFRQTLRYELDQTPTRRAIMEIKQFKTECPDSGHEQECDRMLKELSDRLDLKALESAKLYYKMEDYRAARVALQNVLKDNADNIYREEVLYYTAMSSYKYAHLSVAKKQKERYLVYIDDYLNIQGEYPESKYMKELSTLYKRAQRAIGKNVELDMEDKGDKAFAKERKRIEKIAAQQAKKNDTEKTE